MSGMCFPGSKPCGRSTVLLCTPATYFLISLRGIHIFRVLLPRMRRHKSVRQPAPRSLFTVPVVSSAGALLCRTLRKFHAFPHFRPDHPLPLFSRHAFSQLVSVCRPGHPGGKLDSQKYFVAMHGNHSLKQNILPD